MKLTTALVAALGLLTSVTVALPGPGKQLGAQGSVLNGLGHAKGKGVPRKDLNYHDDSRRSASPAPGKQLGAQGTVMNRLGHAKGKGDPRADPNYRDDSRRSIDTTTEVASKDAELFTITLCNKVNRSGTCVDVPMQKNGCQSFPLLVNTRSLYMTPLTQCWVFNNDECHMTGDINDLWIWRWENTDDLRVAGMTFTPRGWLCDNFDP